MSLIDRYTAANHLKERLIETALNNVGFVVYADDVYRTLAENRIDVWIDEMPTAQPERLTDDDFETIRIHLNAYKEKLCNQQRWGEAEEYQRIIDRFMAFASAQPEQTDCEYCHEDSDGYVRPIEKNSHAYIYPVLDGWHIVMKANKWKGKIPINFCPICGRRLNHG